MSVATVVDNKGGKKPHYKDYVSFLENYRNGKKEDQNSVATNDSGVSFSLTNSSNNSSSSVYSDLTDNPKSSFKEYLESYNNKKYSPVQPPGCVKKQMEKPAETKTVKTEVFLEINSSPTTITKVVDISNAQNVSNVSKVSKLFEKNITQHENGITKNVPPSGKVNTFNFGQRDKEIKQEPKRVSTGERLRKFETKPQKITLRKSNSISEKSRVFEESQNPVNETKVFHKEDDQQPKTNGCVSPKPPVNNIKTVLIPKITIGQHEDNSSPKVNGLTSPRLSAAIKPIVVPKVITETLVFQQNEDISSIKVDGITPTPVVIEKTLSMPPPPPFPQENNQQDKIPPPPPFNAPSAPPPPPPPPANFSVKKTLNPAVTRSSLPAQKVVVNGVNNGVTKNDVVDGTAVPVIDKNDPRVKRLVYGALREMYGAYHDKANDYIATLPRNRVKKNNGLDSIISSIASQGGLEKLNGRVNPSVETD